MSIITDKITTLKYFQISFTIFLNSVKALLILTMDNEQPKTFEIYEFDKQEYIKRVKNTRMRNIINMYYVFNRCLRPSSRCPIRDMDYNAPYFTLTLCQNKNQPSNSVLFNMKLVTTSFLILPSIIDPFGYGINEF